MPLNPLQPQHYSVAEQACRECADLDRYVEELRQLGLEVDAQKAKIDALSTFFNGIIKLRDRESGQ